MWTVTGNIYYCAPEIFHANGYNQEVDVWAIGIVLYQSLCGSLPYSQEKIMEFFDQIGNEEDR
jgi:serine/threonine protein kinase